MNLSTEVLWHCKQYILKYYIKVVFIMIYLTYINKCSVMCIVSISYMIDVSMLIVLLKTKRSPAQNCYWKPSGWRGQAPWCCQWILQQAPCQDLCRYALSVHLSVLSWASLIFFSPVFLSSLCVCHHLFSYLFDDYPEKVDK